MSEIIWPLGTVGMWFDFKKKQPDKEGYYLIYKNGETRMGFWHERDPALINPGYPCKYFTIWPINFDEEGNDPGSINIYEEYIPEYFAEINPPAIDQLDFLKKLKELKGE